MRLIPTKLSGREIYLPALREPVNSDTNLAVPHVTSDVLIFPNSGIITV